MSFASATQLQFRTGRTYPAYPIEWLPDNEPTLLLPEHRTAPLVVPLEWVPQRLWHHPALGTCTPTRSVVLAMCLLKLGRAAGWTTIAVWLGLPPSIRVTVRTELADMRRTDTWRRIPAALEEVFDTLRRNPPPIDYRKRRKVAAVPDLIDKTLRIATDTEVIAAATPALRTRFWELLTCGHADYEPIDSARHVISHGVPSTSEEPPWHALFEILCAISPMPIEGPIMWEPHDAGEPTA